MKVIKTTGTVNERKLDLDSLLTIEKKSRVEVIILISEEIEEDIKTKEEILNDLCISWQEAKNGDTIPVEQLWENQLKVAVDITF